MQDSNGVGYIYDPGIESFTAICGDRDLADFERTADGSWRVIFGRDWDRFHHVASEAEARQWIAEHVSYLFDLAENGPSGSASLVAEEPSRPG